MTMLVFCTQSNGYGKDENHKVHLPSGRQIPLVDITAFTMIACPAKVKFRCWHWLTVYTNQYKWLVQRAMKQLVGSARKYIEYEVRSLIMSQPDEIDQNRHTALYQGKTQVKKSWWLHDYVADTSRAVYGFYLNMTAKGP